MKSKKEKIDSIRGIFKYVLLVLIIVIILLSISLKFLIPCDLTNKGFYVTINGEVTTTESNINHYPKYVYAYYSYHNLNNFAGQGDSAGIGDIIWSGNKGHYSMTFWLPIEMNLIMTADATGCFHERIYVSPDDNIKEINLQYSSERCFEEFKIPEPLEALLKQSRDSLDRLFTASADDIFSINETQSIKDDVKLGSKEIEEMNDESDENKSMIHAYNSYWIVWRAYYKMDIFKLGKCVEKALPLIENSSCVVLPFEAKMKILDSNRSYEYFKNIWIMDENVDEIKSVEEAKGNIQRIYNERHRVNDFLRECEGSLEIIENSYNNQKTKCDLRNQTILLLKWSEALALVCFGFVIFYSIRRWIEK